MTGITRNRSSGEAEGEITTASLAREMARMLPTCLVRRGAIASRRSLLDAARRPLGAEECNSINAEFDGLSRDPLSGASHLGPDAARAHAILGSARSAAAVADHGVVSVAVTGPPV